jgi:hypothetical protein
VQCGEADLAIAGGSEAVIVPGVVAYIVERTLLK